MSGQLAYIAGILDGEGALFVGRYSRPGNAQLAYRGYMAIANTHIPMLEYVQGVIGGKIVTQGKARKCYSLSFSSNEIRKWLPQLMPYLVIKKEQAEVLLAFLERQAENASAPVSGRLLSFYDECYCKLKHLHQVKFNYKAVTRLVGEKTCEVCQKVFQVFSDQPTKKYCSVGCKKKMHWTRSNRRISEGRPAWSHVNIN